MGRGERGRLEGRPTEEKGVRGGRCRGEASTSVTEEQEVEKVTEEEENEREGNK